MKVYEIQYEDDARFNWQQDNVLNTFYDYECNVSVQEDYNGCDKYEIEGEAYDKFLKDFEADNGARCHITEYTPEEVLEWFKSAPRVAHNFVVFQWL